MSTQVSQTITRKSASNLALAFILLPAAKRHGMAALYGNLVMRGLLAVAPAGWLA